LENTTVHTFHSKADELTDLDIKNNVTTESEEVETGTIKN
jgi:hypothetical protein